MDFVGKTGKRGVRLYTFGDGGGNRILVVKSILRERFFSFFYQTQKIINIYINGRKIQLARRYERRDGNKNKTRNRLGSC